MGTEYQIFNGKEYVSLRRFWNMEGKYNTEKAKNEQLEKENKRLKEAMKDLNDYNKFLIEENKKLTEDMNERVEENEKLKLDLEQRVTELERLVKELIENKEDKRCVMINKDGTPIGEETHDYHSDFIYRM